MSCLVEINDVTIRSVRLSNTLGGVQHGLCI